MVDSGMGRLFNNVILGSGLAIVGGGLILQAGNFLEDVGARQDVSQKFKSAGVVITSLGVIGTAFQFNTILDISRSSIRSLAK